MTGKKPEATIRRPPPLAGAPPPDEVQRFLNGGQTSPDVQGRPKRRAPAGSKKLQQRADGSWRYRTTIYFEPETGEQLEAFCKRTGREQSHVVEEALRLYLAAQPTPAGRR